MCPIRKSYIATTVLVLQATIRWWAVSVLIIHLYPTFAFGKHWTLVPGTRFGPQAYPARSPDLLLFYYILWRHMKEPF